MKTSSSFARWVAALVLVISPITLQAANSLTLTPSATSYSPAGGQITFTVTMAYTTATSGLGLDLTAPSGWQFVSVGGTHVPQLVPASGDLGSFNFNYQIVPASPVSFTITVSYPAGKTGNQTFSNIVGTFAAETGNPTSVPHANIVLTPSAGPTVTINQTSGQADPTPTSPINFAVVFSEPVTGFDSTDVVISGTAGATTKVVSGSGAVYNVAVSGMSTSGTVTVSIPAGAAQNAAGLGNTASTSSDATVNFTATANVNYAFANFAGQPGVSGSVDGTGNQAQFVNPYHMAFGDNGNIYVVDHYAHTLRKITPEGVVTTLAGLAGVSGSADGTGGAARFYHPVGVTVDPAGNIYVADSWNHTIRKVTSSGVVTTMAGLAGARGSNDGTASAARFDSPSGLVADAEGNIFVAGYETHTIRKITPSGVVTTLAGLPGVAGSADGTGSAAQFAYPIAVALDSAGNIWVSDLNNRVIRRVTPQGVVTTVAGSKGNIGSVDGAGSAARFYQPSGLSIGPDGALIVADSGNHVVRRVSTTGVVTTIGGLAGASGSTDGVGTNARFNVPAAIAVSRTGIIYVADYSNRRISRGLPVLSTGAPLIVSEDPSPGTVNLPYTFTVLATGSGIVTYRATGLPAGLSINTSTGVISGTPLSSGASTVTITVSNGIAPDAVKVITLSIAPSNTGPAIPTVTTSIVRQISTTGALVEGTVVADGGATITERGYLISKTPGVTMATADKYTDGAGLGTFASMLTTYPLTPGTTYYLRAYAVNSAGIGYGAEVAFTTGDNLLVNGSFESGEPGIFFQVNPGETKLAPWVVVAGQVDLTTSAADGPAADGQRLIDLDGFYSAGTIAQTFTAEAGAEYELSFYINANNVVPPATRPIEVTVGDQTQTLTFDLTGGSRWERRALRFRATAGSQTLTVRSLSAANSAHGALLDYFRIVRLAAAPSGSGFSDTFDTLDTTSKWEVVGGSWSAAGGKVTGSWSESDAYSDHGNLLLREQNLDADFDATVLNTYASGGGFSLYASPGNKMNVNLHYTGVVVERRVNAPGGTPYTVIAESTFTGGSASAPMTFKLTRRGAVFAVYANGTKVLEFVDAVWKGRLRLGLKVYGTTSFDSFTYQPIAASGTVLHALDFNDNQTPAGWTVVRVNGSGNAGIRNGRLEVNPTDSYGYFTRPFSVGASVTRVRVTYRANLDNAYWGMGSAVRLGFADDSGVEARAIKAGWGENAINVSLGNDSANTLVRQVAPGFGTYRFTAEFYDGGVSLRAEDSVSGTVLFDETRPVSGFTLQQVTGLRFFLFTTTDVTGWMDDIVVSAIESGAVVAPTISVQPATQVVTAGANVTLAVVAAGSPAPTYQWRKDRTPISGATNATLTLSSVQFSDSAFYDVVVSNSAGSVTSEDSAKLYVGQPGGTYRLTTPLPETADLASAIQAQFGASAVIADWDEIKAAYGTNLAAFYQMLGLANRFEALVSRAGNRFYGGGRQYYLQRFDNGPTYSGFLAHDQVSTLYLGSWYGITMPVVAKIVTTPPPTITTHPQTQIASAGASVTLTVVATGTPAPTYQWRKNGTNIQAATSASFTLPSAQFADSAVYHCVVSNAGGSTTSNDARVYVGQGGASYRLTTPLSNTADLAAAVQAQFGATATVADWTEIKSAFGGNLTSFYQMIGLGDRLEALVTLNGTRYYGGDRHYYLQRFDTAPYDGFLAHDQSGSLYLGSWFGLTMPVVAKVGGTTSPSFVARQLPASYAPGQDVTVTLHATPAASVGVYAVQDGYPAGWTVKSVGTGGQHDTQNKLVKFGPFFDATARTLTYVVTAPASASGQVSFTGLGSTDGVNSPIGGTQTLDKITLHPADNNAADGVMAIGEVTAYGAAWKRGDAWAIAPNPIPIAYVTRAGFLWKGGEGYRLDPAIAEPPLWWVNTSAPMPASPVRGDLLAIGGASTSVRSVANGATAVVTVTVTPDAAVQVYAVEEVIPAGLTVSAINNSGAFDAVNRKVKWGPYFDNTARTLSYTLSGANATYTLAGVASFDGTNVTTTGVSSAIIGLVAPTFVTHPQNQTVAAGGTVSFTASATGTPAPSYQWQQQPAGTNGFVNVANGGAVSGATTATLTLSGTPASFHGDQFRVIASNGVAPDAFSNAATLTISAPPLFTSLNQTTFTVGQANTFTFTASGRPAPTFSVTTGSLPAWASLNGTSGVLTGNPPSASGSPFSFTVTATNGVNPDATQAFTLSVEAGTIPTITVQPVSRSAPIGATVTLSVTAVGTAPLSYEWRKNGTPVPGGTGATLTLTNVQTSDTGAYLVVVSNSAGSATSNVATVGVVPAGTIAAHAVGGSVYVAGNSVTVTNTFTYTGTATSLGWRVLLPAGWSHLGGAGTEGNVKPAIGTTDVLEWAWNTPPPSPVTFSYTLNVPAGQSGAKELVAVAILRQGEAPIELMAQPDPLVLAPIVTHSADTDRDRRLSLLELTRVIELYNTRNGTTRTGGYKVQDGTEDGFAQDGTRTTTDTVTLTRYHSADTAPQGVVRAGLRDGRIDLDELTRVIQLYNYRAGTVRTGEYHAEPGTEDGFAPGP